MNFLKFITFLQSYSTRLTSLKFEESCTKDDLMGIEDNASKGLFSKTTSLKHKSTIFTIGKRGDILNQQLEAPIIVPHAQLKNRVRDVIHTLAKEIHLKF